LNSQSREGQAYLNRNAGKYDVFFAGFFNGFPYFGLIPGVDNLTVNRFAFRRVKGSMLLTFMISPAW
jgi:allophanate hydrolase subunit 1